MIVLPGLTARGGTAALERVRESLALRLGQATVPWFTASFGIADSDQYSEFEEVVAAADEAMLLAKQQGLVRVVSGAPVGNLPVVGQQPVSI